MKSLTYQLCLLRMIRIGYRCALVGNFCYGYERCAFFRLCLFPIDTLENPIEDANPSAHDWAAAANDCNITGRSSDVLQITDPLGGGVKN